MMEPGKSQEIFLTLEDEGVETEYKITLGECTNYRKGLYERYRQRAFGAMANEYAPLVTLTDEQKKLTDFALYFAVRGLLFPLDADLMGAKLDAAVAHAMILVSTYAVEKRVGEGWERAKLPDFWYDPVQAAEVVPDDLQDTLLQEVFALTPPRVFSLVSTDPVEKKGLRLTVRPSRSLPEPS